MPQICLYLHLHQPYRLGDFDFTDLGNGVSYFDNWESHNAKIFHKVAEKSYYPMLTLLLELTKRHPSFKVAFSTSGVFLDQAEEWSPGVIELLKQLAATDQVEFLAETYYHSLASLFSEADFERQVEMHVARLAELFNYTPVTFRNTELVYSNHISYLVEQLGFSGMLTEAVPRYLHSRPKTHLYRSAPDKPIPLLLKHAELSDDIAFRFSDRNWHHFPLQASSYLDWLHDFSAEDTINLFMDFETFGDHQWADTGIFEFTRHVIDHICASPVSHFVTPREVWARLEIRSAEQDSSNNSALIKTSAQESGVSRLEAANGLKGKNKKTTPITKHTPSTFNSLPIYDVPNPISWADVDRDLTAWLDNDLQQDTITKLYQIEEQVLQKGDEVLLEDWRRLQISDHFYYMCTKWSTDGDVHAYFSPYDSPYEAYRKYSMVLADLIGRV